jgi:hypothetical protein
MARDCIPYGLIWNLPVLPVHLCSGPTTRTGTNAHRPTQPLPREPDRPAPRPGSRGRPRQAIRRRPGGPTPSRRRRLPSQARRARRGRSARSSTARGGEPAARGPRGEGLPGPRAGVDGPHSGRERASAAPGLWPRQAHEPRGPAAYRTTIFQLVTYFHWSRGGSWRGRRSGSSGKFSRNRALRPRLSPRRSRLRRAAA